MSTNPTSTSSPEATKAPKAVHEIVKRRRLGIVGLGRLGLCTALCFERAGWSVLGADVISSYVDAINEKRLRSGEPEVESMLRGSKALKACTSLDEVLAFSDLIFVLVATPTGTTEDQAYDCSSLSKILSEINDRKVCDKHIVINCTVMPGYCANIGTHLLRDCARTSLSYNPEFIAQGDVVRGLRSPDFVLIGQGSSEAGEVLEQAYATMTLNQAPCKRMSVASAEITKLALNCFVTTKIAYACMVGDIADRTPGANKFEILQAVGTDERVGTKCLLPGYGFGGPCFPRDNRALGYYARSLGIEPAVSEATDRFNKLHADYLAQDFVQGSASAAAAGKEERIVFEDVAYKSKCPVDIIEESHKLEVAKRVAKLTGKRILVRDRQGIVELVRRTYGSLFDYEITAPATMSLSKGGDRERTEADGGPEGKRVRLLPSEAPNLDLGNALSSYRR